MDKFSFCPRSQVLAKDEDHSELQSSCYTDPGRGVLVLRFLK